MNKRLLLFIIFLLLVLSGCLNTKDIDNNKLKIVSSFSIITDMVESIGQDKVDVHNLVPPGTDPHEYEPLPGDVKAATLANILLYNGMNLEGGKNGWFFRLAKTVNKPEEKIYNITNRITPLYLTDEKDSSSKINPHPFINPHHGIIMVENILTVLIENDSKNKDFYTDNANKYIESLAEIARKYELLFNSIPDENRIIVTSERAFQYLATEYNITEGYIWAIDTEENGTPKQITRLVNFLKQNPVPYLFLESNVDPRPMQTISSETNIPIFPKRVYSDEIGKKGEENDTYLKYLEHNLAVFSEGLKGINE